METEKWKLEDLLLVLQRHNVQRFASVGVTVEFAPAQSPLPEIEVDDKAICACGHHLVTEHTWAGCLLCDGEKCTGTRT